MVRGRRVISGKGPWDWWSSSSLRSSPIPAQLPLAPRAPFTHLWAPAHAQRGQSSETGVGGWWGHRGTELTAVCVSGCNLCSVHKSGCVPPLLRALHGSQLTLGKGQGPRCGPPKGLDGLPVPSLTSSPPASLLAYSTTAHPPASRSLMCQTHSNFNTFAPAGPSAWTSLPSIAPELPLSPLSSFESNVAFSEGPPLTVLFKIEAP